MALLASEIVGDARSTLIDDDVVTYSEPQLRGFVTDAQRMVVDARRDAYTKRGFIPLVEGTNQELPADGLQVLDISQNEVSKRAATLVDKLLLDNENRFWQRSTGERDVQHWCADPRDPRRFDVTPPNDGTGSIFALYVAVPPVLDAVGSELVVPETFKYALYCFTLHRAYAENSRKGDTVKADYWHNKGMQSLGVSVQSQVASAPKLSSNPGN